jgi:integrase
VGLFEADPVAGDYGPVESEPGLRAVPVNELADGVIGASVATPWLPFSWVAASGERRQRPWRWRRCSKREEHWVIPDRVGKGGHVRTVPVPSWVKAAVDDWLNAAEVNAGPVFRAINKAQRVGKSAFSPKVIWGVVKAGSSKCSLENVAPHDLRRTCARLCHEAGGELEQIQFLLGHVSVQTTERYLGCKQRLRNAVNDRIGLEPANS